MVGLRILGVAASPSIGESDSRVQGSPLFHVEQPISVRHRERLGATEFSEPNQMTAGRWQKNFG
jgi:hypothetical protein